VAAVGTGERQHVKTTTRALGNEVEVTSKTKLVLLSVIALLVIAVVIGVSVWGTSREQAGGASQSTPAPLSSAASPPPQAQVGDPSAELAKLATLPIKGRAPKTGYARSLFGRPWTDDVTVLYGHNGCDTRDDILRVDLVGVGVKPGTHNCIVLSGTLRDPYSGTTVFFQRGQGTSSQVQVDHVVALLDAWQKGAQQWDAAKRRNFANDPINLQATTAAMNQQKGAGDAATWLPPNKSYRCTYVSRIVDVKATYGLWVTQAERDAITRILSECGQPAAVG
jgi:Protein of unknown function (DUF1524)